MTTDSVAIPAVLRSFNSIRNRANWYLFKANIMRTYIVRYVEDEEEDNVKYYQVEAYVQADAHSKVDDYIEENNHHPSINYGYTLSTVKSAPKIDYIVPKTSDNKYLIH